MGITGELVRSVFSRNRSVGTQDSNNVSLVNIFSFGNIDITSVNSENCRAILQLIFGVLLFL